MAQNPAERRYNLTVLGLSAAYGVALASVDLLFRHTRPVGVLAYLAAVIPALPIIGIFAAIGRYLVDESDEYLRMLMIRQTLIASGFALSFATAWGFLESFGLAPHIDAYYVAVLWFGGLGAGAVINKLTLENGR